MGRTDLAILEATVTKKTLDGRKNVRLAMSEDGNGTIYVLPENNAGTAVAIPVRDKDMGWHKANPETYQAMIDRFNATSDLHPTLQTMIDEAVKEERERCAQICEAIANQSKQYHLPQMAMGAQNCRDDIRKEAKP